VVVPTAPLVALLEEHRLLQETARVNAALARCATEEAADLARANAELEELVRRVTPTSAFSGSNRSLARFVHQPHDVVSLEECSFVQVVC
jgi:hypothetical protein